MMIFLPYTHPWDFLSAPAPQLRIGSMDLAIAQQASSSG
jgi:hypothetical protein